LKKDDDERRKWARSLYGIDTADANLYDVVLHIDNLEVDDAVDIINHMVDLPCVRSTADSKKILDNKVLAARVQAMIIAEFPTATVRAEDGIVFIGVEAPIIQEETIINKIREMAKDLDGVEQVRINVVPQLTSE